ncbi:hypothetical protein [Burkholderia cepacia]|uniref:hypothetical protein n=1 Tax=Burkholderia cepacia TaxID=292 RepID=UPI002AB60AA4|nr:hypothetical protein [Burkholderia cepacia]
MNASRASRRWRSIEQWPEKQQVAYHAVLGGLLILLAWTFERAGSVWKTTAHHGDPIARAEREWGQGLSDYRNAVSALEDAATGAGCALIGFGFLQVGYAVIVSGRDRSFEPFVMWQWAVFAIGTAGLSYAVGSHSFPGTRLLMGVIVAAYFIVPLMWRQQVRRAALVVPQWITAAVGAVFWLAVEGMWRLFHAPHGHEAPVIVTMHLGLGLTGLAIASWALGWAARRTTWLRPAPIRRG